MFASLADNLINSSENHAKRNDMAAFRALGTSHLGSRIKMSAAQ
jgi:hypothetical protein